MCLEAPEMRDMKKKKSWDMIFFCDVYFLVHHVVYLFIIIIYFIYFIIIIILLFFIFFFDRGANILKIEG